MATEDSMNNPMAGNEIEERLKLIEQMIGEGRRTTGRWGWIWVLWGGAYLVATGWSAFDKSGTPWAVTMPVAAVLSSILARRNRKPGVASAVSRAMSGIWTGVGIALLLVLFSLSFSGHYEVHTFLAIIGGMLGVANFASSVILRWPAQMFCALVWWVSAAVGCFLSVEQAGWAFLTATFLAQIVFGVYVMATEGKKAGEVARG